MAPSVPPSLKKIKVFLSRAEELDRDRGNPESRVVAYNLRQYAVLTGIPLAGADPAAKACLGDLLNDLEKEKAAMAVFSKAEHWKISRKVADRVFEKADAEDRAGAASKGTAKTFYAAGTFYEILQQFHEEEKEGDESAAVEGELDESKAQQNEEEQRRIYCKWKATEILNAVKEGRTPTPGGYKEEEPEEVASPMITSPPDVPTDVHGLPTVGDEELPPAPSMPSSNFFDVGGNNETNQHSGPAGNVYSGMPPPPTNNGFELSINGEPTPTTVGDVDEDSEVEEIFIPDSANNAEKNNVFDETPTPNAPPPPYTDLASARSYDTTPSVPPPAASRPLPPPAAAAPSPSTNAGVFSSIFGGHSSSNKKLTKSQMADVIELTKFALSALQQGDGDLGRERLEQALGVWRSTPKKNSGSTFSLFGKSSPSAIGLKLSQKQLSDATELTKFALATLNQGDGKLGKEKLKQALDVCKK